MEKISGLKISEAEYVLPNKSKAKVAVLMYHGDGDPKKILDYAVSIYVQNDGYHELIDAHLDNPWMRVLLSDINNMKQENFNPEKHRLISKNNG
jgi:hypothetical protein